MCSSRKYPYSPHRRDWNFLEGGGFCKAKHFKEMYEASLEFPEGWGGVLEKIPYIGEVWIFSEITHCSSSSDLPFPFSSSLGKSIQIQTEANKPL